MRHTVPIAIAIAVFVLSACATAPPLPGFGVEVSLKLSSAGRQVCIAGKNFTPDTSVQTGYIDIPGASTLSPAQTVTASHAGDFNVVDVTTGYGACTLEQQGKDVLVFAKDMSNGNVAVGKLPARLWCQNVIQVVPVDSRCP